VLLLFCGLCWVLLFGLLVPEGKYLSFPDRLPIRRKDRISI